MQHGFEVVAAKSKKDEGQDAPTQVSMQRQEGLRRNPSGDQRKIRHQQARNGGNIARTAAAPVADSSGTGQPERITCSNCGSGEAYASTGLCPQCGHMNKTSSLRTCQSCGRQINVTLGQDEPRDHAPGCTEQADFPGRDDKQASFQQRVAVNLARATGRKTAGRTEFTVSNPLLPASALTSTIAEILIPEILAIPSGEKQEFVINGSGYTVYYDEQGASGDDGRPVRGDVTGDYEVHKGVDGPMGLRLLDRHHVGPHGSSGYGNPEAKNYAARQVASTIGSALARVASKTAADFVIAEPCPRCGGAGDGADEFGGRTTCRTCNGEGVITASKTGGAPSNVCPKCGGAVDPLESADGQSLRAECSNCGWTGTKTKTSARSDYDHWNEDADRVWYEEEGRHPEEPPDPDDFYDDRDVYEDDEDEDDDPNHEPTHDSPPYDRPYSATRSKTMSTPIHREAELLRALAVATPEEQVRLMADLDALRSGRTASRMAQAEIDLDATVIADYLTPVSTHSYHTAATDWIEEVGVEEGEFDHNALLTEATLWFRRTSSEVKADREEFAAQAQGYAVRTASQFGTEAPAAARLFLDHVAHLHRTAGTETGDNANAISALPDEVPLEGHEQVLDNFQPPVAPINSGVTPEDTSSTRAPNVASRQVTAASCSQCGAEIERDPAGEEPRTWHHNDGSKHDHEASPSSGEGESKESRRSIAVAYDDAFVFEASDPIADPSGQSQSGLPQVEVGNPNDREPWPWEIDENGERKGEDAADVASVPTPGQGVADYPQPKGASRRPFGERTAGGLENLGDERAPEFDEDDEDEDKKKASLRVQARSISEIASEIRSDWSNVYFGAVPYLDAMDGLDAITDRYYEDTGKSIVAYFLSNASGWRGETAKRVKAELKAMMAGKTAGATATCAHCDKQIEDDDGTWYHVDSMQTRCDGPDDEDGIGWGDLVRQAEPKTGSRRQAGSDEYDNGDSDEGTESDAGYWGDEPDFDSFEDDAEHEGGGWVSTAPKPQELMEGGVKAASVNRPVPLTPTQQAFRDRVRAAAIRPQS